MGGVCWCTWIFSRVTEEKSKAAITPSSAKKKPSSKRQSKPIPQIAYITGPEYNAVPKYSLFLSPPLPSFPSISLSPLTFFCLPFPPSCFLLSPYFPFYLIPPYSIISLPPSLPAFPYPQKSHSVSGIWRVGCCTAKSTRLLTLLTPSLRRNSR